VRSAASAMVRLSGVVVAMKECRASSALEVNPPAGRCRRSG